MSMKTRIVGALSFGRRSLVFATLALASLGVTAPVLGPGARGEDGPRAHQGVLGQAGRQDGIGFQGRRRAVPQAQGRGRQGVRPAREKLSAEMEVLSKKWAIAREKLATTVELQMNSLGEEFKELEEKADKATGPTREQMDAEMKKLHEEWTAAREKMESTLSSNLKSSREEIEHLKEHVSDATADAKAKLGPRMERLKAEYPQESREARRLPRSRPEADRGRHGEAPKRPRTPPSPPRRSSRRSIMSSRRSSIICSRRKGPRNRTDSAVICDVLASAGLGAMPYRQAFQ